MECIAYVEFFFLNLKFIKYIFLYFVANSVPNFIYKLCICYIDCHILHSFSDKLMFFPP